MTDLVHYMQQPYRDIKCKSFTVFSPGRLSAAMFSAIMIYHGGIWADRSAIVLNFQTPSIILSTFRSRDRLVDLSEDWLIHPTKSNIEGASSINE